MYFKSFIFNLKFFGLLVDFFLGIFACEMASLILTLSLCIFFTRKSIFCNIIILSGQIYITNYIKVYPDKTKGK